MLFHIKCSSQNDFFIIITNVTFLFALLLPIKGSNTV